MFRFCWFWAYIFLKKKIILIIVTLILSGKICCNFSHKNRYYSVQMVGAFGQWPSFYSYYFQTRQIPTSKQHFFVGIITLFLSSQLLRVTTSEKKNFFQFEISFSLASKQKETYFSTRKLLWNFEVHDHWLCREITFWVIYNF